MWPGRPALAVTAQPASVASILGASLVEYWHAGKGVSLSSNKVVSWTGQALGLQLGQSDDAQRAVYGAAGSAFGGKPVVSVDGKLLQLTGSAVLYAAGSKPYLAAWLKCNSLPGWATILQLANYPVSQNAPGLYRDATTLQAWCSAGGAATVTNTSLSPIFVEAYYDTANSAIAIDGGTPVLGTSGALAADVTFAQSNFGTFAMIVVCKSVPSQAQRAALRAYAIQQFPP